MNGFGKRSRSLAKSFACFKPHTRPLAVPIEEDHPGSLKRVLKLDQGATTGIGTVFKSANGIRVYLSLFRELTNAPIKRRTGHFELSRRNH